MPDFNLSFHPVTLDEQARYRKALAAMPEPASDYSFGNLWGWASHYGLEWTFSENGVCWLRQTRPAPARLWAPVGDWRTIPWEKALAPGTTMIRVPQTLCAFLAATPGVRIEETPGQWDYLYSVRELTELRGNRFHRKKNLLSQFLKNYAWTYEPLTARRLEEVRELEREWEAVREQTGAARIEGEDDAIRRVLDAWERLEGMMGGLLRVDGSLAAYTVAEPLAHGMLVIHFEKGLTRYKGIYQAMNAIFLREGAQEFETVDREQDMDEEGLRQAKRSYNPIGYIRKNTLHID